MGAECVRASPRPTKAGSSYSLENKFSPQKGKTNGPYEFEFMIENLCVPSTCNVREGKRSRWRKLSSKWKVR